MVWKADELLCMICCKTRICWNLSVSVSIWWKQIQQVFYYGPQQYNTPKCKVCNWSNSSSSAQTSTYLLFILLLIYINVKEFHLLHYLFEYSIRNHYFTFFFRSWVFRSSSAICPSISVVAAVFLSLFLLYSKQMTYSKKQKEIYLIEFWRWLFFCLKLHSRAC